MAIPQHRSPAAPAPASVTARGLHELKAIRAELAAREARAQAEQAARAAAIARREAARHVFARAVGPVHPLPDRDRAVFEPDLPPPIPVQHQLDEARVMQESISDDFDASTLLDTDDALSFRREGVGVDVTRRLRRGEWAIQRQIDLHGLRTDEAREALGGFVRESAKHGLRCLRVVHGKGLGSVGKTPVLKGRVQGWLVQKQEVLAFVQARPIDGGAGALVVLLRPMKRRLPAG
ncbi:DNA mismatch repair protein MutS [Xylophilus rhododendri]|uniref:DNA mismatch repair protein MutS n=1 Tax=Xylophilus rhododendri TaxID=2697032 RepID=A0A857J9I4_9BURK|nr:Smr/MutS family protein [Xylophilus rhododendri]QHI99883.1 DNA mismatch repair protein MutS [Xylophilus rhododendri]